MKSFRFSRFIHSIVMLGFLMPIAAQSQATWKQRTLDRAKQITQRAKSGSERALARIAATLQLGKKATIKRLEREYALVKTGAKAARKKLKGQSLTEDEKKDLRSLEIRAGALVALMILAAVTTGSAILLTQRRPENGDGPPPAPEPEAPVPDAPLAPPPVAPPAVEEPEEEALEGLVDLFEEPRELPAVAPPPPPSAPAGAEPAAPDIPIMERVGELRMSQLPDLPAGAAAGAPIPPPPSAPTGAEPAVAPDIPIMERVGELRMSQLPDLPVGAAAGAPIPPPPPAEAEVELEIRKEEIDRGMQNINQLVFSGEATLESDQNTLNMINRLREALIDANRNYGTQNWIETHLDNLGRFEETVRTRMAGHETEVAERRPAPPLPPRDMPAPPPPPAPARAAAATASTSVPEQVAAKAIAAQERATEKQREIDELKSELAELPSTSRDVRTRRRRAILTEKIERLNQGLPATKDRPRQSIAETPVSPAAAPAGGAAAAAAAKAQERAERQVSIEEQRQAWDKAKKIEDIETKIENLRKQLLTAPPIQAVMIRPEIDRLEQQLAELQEPQDLTAGLSGTGQLSASWISTSQLEDAGQEERRGLLLLDKLQREAEQTLKMVQYQVGITESTQNEQTARQAIDRAKEYAYQVDQAANLAQANANGLREMYGIGKIEEQTEQAAQVNPNSLLVQFLRSRGHSDQDIEKRATEIAQQTAQIVQQTKQMAKQAQDALKTLPQQKAKPTAAAARPTEKPTAEQKKTRKQEIESSLELQRGAVAGEEEEEEEEENPSQSNP